MESLLARLAHSQNYLLVTPSREQVGGQPAMEALPLIMEPESRFYASPLVVLDFQSLYPSMVIAYNLCYSTAIGRPMHAQVGARRSQEAGSDTAVLCCRLERGCSCTALPYLVPAPVHVVARRGGDGFT